MVEIKDIEKLAELSRISLTDAEKGQMRQEIEAILGYVQQIQAVSGAPKTADERLAHKENEEVRNVLREDGAGGANGTSTTPVGRQNTPGEFTEAILANVPKREGQYVKVKKILG